MAAESTEATAPSFWALYLVNGDASGLTDAEQAAADAWCALQAAEGWSVHGIVDDSERFTWSYRLHHGDADGGEVCDYILLRPCWGESGA
jgi:hypothetical protein